MIRARGGVEVCQMTACACGAGRRKVIVGVALGALQPRMRAGEGKTRELGMVKLCADPAIHGVALLAVRGEIKRGMARVGRLLKICVMARDTRGRETGKSSVRSAFVAGIAAQRGVRSDQWTPVLMLLDVVDRDLPAFD